MKISVVCFGAMREYLPEGAQGNRAELEVSDGATVREAVDALRAPGTIVHAVLVNEEPGSLDRRLREGDEITLMPRFTGG